jgi:hypothetical protein
MDEAIFFDLSQHYLELSTKSEKRKKRLIKRFENSNIVILLIDYMESLQLRFLSLNLNDRLNEDYEMLTLEMK